LAKTGVLARVFDELQRQQVVKINLDVVSVDSTSIKVHPDGFGALKKTANNPLVNPVEDGQPGSI